MAHEAPHTEWSVSGRDSMHLQSHGMFSMSHDGLYGQSSNQHESTVASPADENMQQQRSQDSAAFATPAFDFRFPVIHAPETMMAVQEGFKIDIAEYGLVHSTPNMFDPRLLPLGGPYNNPGQQNNV
jgi:hypothetical protein